MTDKYLRFAGLCGLLFFGIGIYACIMPFPFYWIPLVVLGIGVLLGVFLDGRQTSTTAPVSQLVTIPIYLTICVAVYLMSQIPLWMHPEITPKTIAIVPLSKESQEVMDEAVAKIASSFTSSSTTTAGTSNATSAPATTPTNEVVVKLEARVSDLNKTTPRHLRQLFTNEYDNPEWKAKAKAIHQDIEHEVAKLHEALKGKLDNPASLSPAELELFHSIERNWGAETAGTLNWPFNTWENLLSAIVPGGYRDEAPAVLVSYLQDRLSKLRRLHGVLSP